MTQSTEAVYVDGVLKPERELDLRERQRVRLTIEAIDDVASDRAAALSLAPCWHRAHAVLLEGAPAYASGIA